MSTTKHSRYCYYGRRNGDGHPTPTDQQSLFGEYITDMEGMSYRTQEDLRSSRLQAHFQRISLKDSRDLVTQLQWEKNNFCLKMLRQKRTITRLRKKIAD